ncbi:MAG: RND transporter [bacterium]|nr:RND transporter [bacterium]MDT8396078.1 RND transporter [bacterium]
MQQLIAWIDSLDWGVVIVICLTLGLAPFSPPHIVEKLQMLMKGKLVKPIDWFDLVMHSAPWVVLVVKVVLRAKS